MHTVPHATIPSYRAKIIDQPLKKFLSLVVSWVKFDGKILTFKVNFLCLKLSESFYFFSLKNMIVGAHFLLLTFFENITSKNHFIF